MLPLDSPFGLARDTTRLGPRGLAHGRSGSLALAWPATSEAPQGPSRVVEAPGVAETQRGFHDLASTRVFLVNLLIRTTFDAVTDSSHVLRDPPTSTEFLETLWRRREPVPNA